MRYMVGDRITAILSANEKEIKLLGHGVYEGDHLPPSDSPVLLAAMNPRLRLDDGTVLWGYQCWWGAQEQVLSRMKAKFPQARIVEVKLGERT